MTLNKDYTGQRNNRQHNQNKPNPGKPTSFLSILDISRIIYIIWIIAVATLGARPQICGNSPDGAGIDFSISKKICKFVGRL